MAMLLATILDPRCKKTHGWPNELREKVKTELKNKYKMLKSTNNTLSQENPTVTRPSSIDSLQMHIFGPQVMEDDDEFNIYFNNTPQASCDTNPFQWWQNNKETFSVLFKL